jgi:hypothetical protein
MSITDSKLKQIILEEYNKLLQEISPSAPARIKRAIDTASDVAAPAARTARSLSTVTPVVRTTPSPEASDISDIAPDISDITTPKARELTSTEEDPSLWRNQESALKYIEANQPLHNIFSTRWNKIMELPDDGQLGPMRHRRNELARQFMSDIQTATRGEAPFERFWPINKEPLEPGPYTPPAPTQTLVPALQRKYFGPEPDLAYRRVLDPEDEKWEPYEGEEFQYTPQSQDFSWIGGGRWRRAYDMQDHPDKVLKTAIVGDMSDPGTHISNTDASYRSRLMNKFEASPEYQQSPLAPKVFWTSPDFSSMVVERVNQLTDWHDIFQFFPNFQKHATSNVRMSQGRAWTNDISQVFPEILANNRPIVATADLERKIDLLEVMRGELHDAIRTALPEYSEYPIQTILAAQAQEEFFQFTPEVTNLLDNINQLKRDPAVDLMHRYKLLRSPYPGEFNLTEAAQMLNELITDPQVSNLRDHASKYRSLGGETEDWGRYNDFRPGNLGYTINPDTGEKMLKVIDSGYKTDPARL